MKKYMCRSGWLLSFILISFTLAGQHGWTVNPAAYTYSGEVTAVVFDGPTEVTTGTLGAFVGGTCRGYADGVVFPLTGKTVFIVLCYSNIVSGETITFKYFDPSDNSTHDIVETVTFTDDMTLGNAATPLQFHICDPVSIGTQPSDVTLCAGPVNASFGTIALGSSPFVYQWQYYNGSTWANVTNGTPSGAIYSNPNSSTLGISGTISAGTYRYRCYVTNCNANQNDTSDEALLTLNANPLPLVLSGSSICESPGGNGTITSATSVAGISYQLYNSAKIAVQPPKSGNGTGLTWSLLPAGTGYYVIGTNTTTNCVSSASNTVSITTTPNPLALVLAGSTICESPGGNGTITSATSETGVNYQLYNSSDISIQAAKAGTGSGLTWSSLPAGNGYYVIGINAITSCVSPRSNSVSITASPNPTPLVLTGSTICESPGGNGTITSPTSASGVSYQLYNSLNNAVQTPKTGTGSGLTWSSLPAGNGYYVVGTLPGGCNSTSNPVNISTTPNPASLVLTGSTICEQPGGNGTITSSTSVIGVNYQLYNSSDSPVQASKPGTGSGLAWSLLQAGNGYYVIATNSATCTTKSNTVNVATNPNPAALVLSGSIICVTPGGDGVITSTTSTPGVSYQLYNSSDNPVQTSKSGTGSGLTWTGITAGNGYYVIATNSSNCTATSNTVNVITTANPVALVLSGSTICVSPGDDGIITSSASQNGVNYQLYNSSGTTVQAAKAGSGSGLTWSSLPAGNGYYVIATNSAGCTSTSNPVNITTTPNPVALVLTGSTICASPGGNGTITSSTSVTGVTYQLYNSSGNPVQTVKAGTGSILLWSSLSPGDDYYVIATNAAGCTAKSNPVDVATWANPIALSLSGSIICVSPGGDGTIKSTSSQSGVSYQLYSSTNTPVQAPKTGTGSILTWSSLPAGNGYYVIASSAEGCTATSNSVNITTTANPVALVLSGSTICVSPGGTGTITSTTSVVGVIYQLYNASNIPVQAAKGGTGSGLTWTSLTAGNGYYVVSTNSTGCEATSNPVNIATYPNPTITTTGTLNAVCYSTGAQATTLAYSATTNSPVSYSIDWDATANAAGLADQGNTLFAFNAGGGIMTGIVITAGTSAGGPYSGTLTIRNANGCTASQTIRITVNALPVVAPISGTTSVCVGSTTTLSSSPSGGIWTSGTLSVATVNPSTGVVSGVAAGSSLITYTVTSGDCSNSVSQTVNVIALPSPPSIGTITHPTCEVATGSVVLNNLPATGWTITGTPGDISRTGTGTSTTISGLTPDTYRFTVTSSSGCTSGFSANAVVNPQPPSPSVPVHTVNCSLGYGKAEITVTSPVGGGYTYRLDEGAFQTSNVFTNVANGTHRITVRNSVGCTTTGDPFTVSCGCANPPTVTLSSTSGSTCGTSAITVSGNTFGGSATSVSLSENGGGSLSPPSSATSPFTFTYTPSASDAGKTITITVTTNNPDGFPCTPAVATYSLVVNVVPPPPVVGPIVHPTCALPTGSVTLSGLPASGTWTLTRNDAVSIKGEGTTITIPGLSTGTYTYTVTNADNCTSLPSANIVINPQPATPTAPVIATPVTQPTCTVSTGSVGLSGLPSSGPWTLTRTRSTGEIVTSSGTGTTYTATGILPGTYTFRVTNSQGCVSPESQQVVVDAQPPTPTKPVIDSIGQPTCTVATGTIYLSGLPSGGTWTLTRFPDNITRTGTGTTTVISGLTPRTYYFTVTNEFGCTSGVSNNAVVNTQPPTPSTPVVGTITHPTFSVPTGSVQLKSLPSTGVWIITRWPEGIKRSGTGTSVTITGLEPGTYTFTVTNSVGCTSAPTGNVVINARPGPPNVIITDPDTICSNQTTDLTSPEVTAGSDDNLTFTYWLDNPATVPLENPEAAPAGLYYIKGTTTAGYFTIKPVTVTADQMPVADAGPDQLLDYILETSMSAEFVEYGSGLWSVVSGTGAFDDEENAHTWVDGLAIGVNMFKWTVTNGVCPPVSDNVMITVNDLVVPTLITPNGDPYNEYFILRGLEETLGKTELVVFDRRGMQVFKSDSYENEWNGLDDNGNELPDDTYFWTLKAANGRSLSGFIVIRR